MLSPTSSVPSKPLNEIIENVDTFWGGFQQLLAQQRAEITHLKSTFDLSVFAGLKGPLFSSQAVLDR